MRRAAKVDDNQGAIVAALRRAGAAVQSLAMVGNGCPDLLVSFRGRTLVLEVKDGSKVPSARRLTPKEEAWSSTWPGEWHLVESPEDALRAIGAVAEIGTRTNLPR